MVDASLTCRFHMFEKRTQGWVRPLVVLPPHAVHRRGYCVAPESRRWLEHSTEHHRERLLR